MKTVKGLSMGRVKKKERYQCYDTVTAYIRQGLSGLCVHRSETAVPRAQAQPDPFLSVIFLHNCPTTRCWTAPTLHVRANSPACTMACESTWHVQLTFLLFSCLPNIFRSITWCCSVSAVTRQEDITCHLQFIPLQEVEKVEFLLSGPQQRCSFFCFALFSSN